MAASQDKPAAVFWDMDGTLTDSEPLWEEAVYYVSELMGRRATPEVRAQTIGGTVHGTLRILARWAGVELAPADYERYAAAMLDYVSSLYASRLRIFPGVRSLLEAFHADGIPQLITTNTQRAVAQPVFEAIRLDFFQSTICGDEVPHGKPAPDMYREAARRVGADPASCLVFEDSFTGMQAAADAGCVVVGLPHDGLTVPRGVAAIGQLRGGGAAVAHVAGVTAVDVYRWFAALSGAREA